jgi:soluble lytic murein transglycosylase-like protein
MMSQPVLSLFGQVFGSFPVPVETASAVARSRGQGRPSGRRGTRLVLGGDEHGRKMRTTGANQRPSRAWRAAVALLAAPLLLVPIQASAADAARRTGSAQRVASTHIADAVDEASRRFGLPKAWILAVMAAESGGQQSAVSSKGAMGLMQLMPQTWRELSAELALGDDAFEPRANILAGAAYLRRMYDRFGAPGFLAAYNAGPRRYERFLAGERALPAETRDYVRRISAKLALDVTLAPSKAQADWRASDLFVTPGVMLDHAELRP